MFQKLSGILAAKENSTDLNSTYKASSTHEARVWEQISVWMLFFWNKRKHVNHLAPLAQDLARLPPSLACVFTVQLFVYWVLLLYEKFVRNKLFIRKRTNQFFQQCIYL
jgi:hypothetical protein